MQIYLARKLSYVAVKLCVSMFIEMIFIQEFINYHLFYDNMYILGESFSDLTVSFNKRETIIDLKRLHLYSGERRETVLNIERNLYMDSKKALSTFYKWYKKQPVANFFIVLTSFQVTHGCVK
mgnify:FL=1